MSSIDDEALEARLRGALAMEDAPTAALARALSLGSPAARAETPSILRRILAALSFDSATALEPALSVRSGGGGARQLLFFAEGRDIDLRIAPSARVRGRFDVAGQILGPDLVGTIWIRGEGGAWRADLDALGEFRVEALPSGRYEMTVTLPEVEIELAAFEVADA